MTDFPFRVLNKPYGYTELARVVREVLDPRRAAIAEDPGFPR
jgi:hypothetical protein